jgi:hypothetical protein
MDYNQPYGAGAGAAYVNGNPATGVAGSIPPAAAIEYPQREIVGVIADCGLTPDNANLHQLALAVQSGQLSYADDTGTATNLVVTLPRAPTAYVKGMRLSTKLLNTIGANSTINFNGLGAVAMNYRGGVAIQQGDFKAGDIVEMVYDGAAMQVQPPSMIIDTAVTFTVHGTSPNFTDLNAAMEYLSKFKITRNGSVVLQISGAASGSAQQFTYSQSVLIDHPNSDKITITGPALIGAAPTDTSFAYTGVRATDAANDLAMLRGRLPTELHFTGGANIVCFGSVSFNNLLITGDGTAVSSSFANTGAGMAFTTGQPSISNVSVHGFGSFGIICNNAYLVALGTFASSSGNTYDGVELQASSLFPAQSGQFISASNGGNGFTVQGGCTIISGNVTAKGNATHGILVTGGGSTNLSGCRIYSNGAWGCNCIGGYLGVINSFWTGNGSGSAIAQQEASVTVTGANSLGTCSPAVNVVGNSNSIVIN